MKIYNTELGKGYTFIIAELCSNIILHLDDLEGCVEQVAQTGATAAKVQLFKAEHFPLKEQSEKRKWEFPRDRFEELVSLCHNRGLACGASVFDEEAVEIVAKHGDFIKLATREWNNNGLFDACVDTSLPMICSYDCRGRESENHPGGFDPLFMACVPEYPVTNLKIGDLRGEGWSSHTDHWLDVVVAVTMGAIVVEKHLAFDPHDPEAKWSLLPGQFSQMVSDVRWVESVR